MRIIFFVGPPGSGKGTQADILAKRYDMFHFETSRFLEMSLESLEMAEQKKLFDSGVLVSPEWVAQVVTKESEKLIKEGKTLVFSGSPRTMLEAERVLPLFEDLVGKDGIMAFHIYVNEAESVKRNSARKICEKNRHPIPNFPEYTGLKVCPEDGSAIISRGILDSPEVIKKRLKEYADRTKPILEFLKNRGCEIVEINGEQSIEDVSKDIIKHIDVHHQN